MPKAGLMAEHRVTVTTDTLTFRASLYAEIIPARGYSPPSWCGVLDGIGGVAAEAAIKDGLPRIEFDTGERTTIRGLAREGDDLHFTGGGDPPDPVKQAI